MLCVLGSCICLALSLPAQERTAGGSPRQASPPRSPAPLLKIYEDFAKMREAAAGTTDSARVRPARRVQQADTDTAPDPAYPFLLIAYDSLREEDFDTAIQNFLKGIAASPNRTDIRKDCAYTYFKVGQNENARQQFLKVMQLDPTDYHSALEVAFLDYEIDDPGMQAEARRSFLTISQVGDPQSKATAQAAFNSIDQSLANDIQNWSEAVRLDPTNLFAHIRLAYAAEKRDNLDLAVQEYTASLGFGSGWVYLDLARVLQEAGRITDARDALTKASQQADPYTAETAKDKLGSLGGK